MAPQDRISRLAQQIGDRLQNASQAPEDIQKGVQQVVRGAFDRLELVSREEASTAPTTTPVEAEVPPVPTPEPDSDSNEDEKPTKR